MSWGLDDWGAAVWGADPSLYLVEAVAITTHSVLVTVNRPIRLVSQLGAGDGLNPASWQITDVTAGTSLDVVRVIRISSTKVQIFVRQPLRSWNYYHRVQSLNLYSTTGVLISLPYSQDFRGVVQAATLQGPEGPFDLATTDIAAGSLRTTEAGTYARVYGTDLIRKMVYRRLTTMPGSYFHIPPDDFGLGLKVKEPLRVSGLAALKRQIEDEIGKEPGVQGVRAAVSLSQGVVSIRLAVLTSEGETEVAVAAS